MVAVGGLSQQVNLSVALVVVVRSSMASLIFASDAAATAADSAAVTQEE